MTSIDGDTFFYLYVRFLKICFSMIEANITNKQKKKKMIEANLLVNKLVIELSFYFLLFILFIVVSGNLLIVGKVMHSYPTVPLLFLKIYFGSRI